MVLCFPMVLFFVPGKVRKVDDPGKVEFVGGIVKVKVFSKLLSHRSKRDAGNLPFFVADKKQKIVLFRSKLGTNFRFLAGKEFRNAAFKISFGVDLHPSKSLCLVLLCDGLQLFHHLAGILVGHVLDDKRLKSASLVALDVHSRVGGSGLKGVKVTKARHKGRVLNLKVKAQVWLVASVKVESVVPRDAVKLCGKIVVQRLFENVAHHSFGGGKNFLAVGERHFHIDLRELRLAVAAGVFVAVATRDLEILVKARHHQKLLVKLGALRKRIKFSGVDAAWNQVVARAFGS